MSGQLVVAKISWAEVCKRYPDEWVLLADIEKDHVWMIMSVHVLDHDTSKSGVPAPSTR
jgi:hypothetical protein